MQPAHAAPPRTAEPAPHAPARESTNVADDPDVAREIAAISLTDADIATRAAAVLARAPAIPDVAITVNSGIVTLTGAVLDQPTRERAERLVKTVAGVKEVENRLELSSDLGARWSATWKDLRRKATQWIAGTPLLLAALLLILASRWLGRMVARGVQSLRWRGANPYIQGLVGNVVQSVFLIAGALVALDLLGATKLVGALLGSAGLIGITLGFAFRDIAENHIAGVLLSVRRPFAPGDHVVIDQHEGRVVSLSSRATSLMTLDGNHLRLPNALVFKSVVLNYTHNPRRRMRIEVDLDASQSIRVAQQAGLESIAAVEGILSAPPPSCLVREFSSRGIRLEYLAWIDQNSTDFARARSACVHAVKRAFAKAGLETPRSIHYVTQQLPTSTATSDHNAPPSEDTSPNLEIEGQLQRAREENADHDLLADHADRRE